MKKEPYGIRAIALVMLGACLATASAEPVYGPLNNPEDQWREMSLHNGEKIPEIAVAGFNVVHCGVTKMWSLATCAPKKTLPESLAKFKRISNRCQAAGIGLTPYFGYAHDFEAKKLYPRIRRDGSEVKEIDAANPEFLDRLARAFEHDVALFRDCPGITAVTLAEEMRGRAEPSFTPALADAYRRATGREIPGDAIGRNPVPWQEAKGFPADRIVPDDWPVLDFYRWFWREGDGWSKALDVMADAFRKAYGRGGYVNVFAPVLRAPSQWDNLGSGVTYHHNWTYTTPEPYRILYPIAELQASVRNRPGAMIHASVQGIMYRSSTAPIKKHPKDEPAWAKEFPNARYITTAPDILEESYWHVFSRKVDGTGTHHESSLFDLSPHDSNSYQCTTSESIARIGKVFREVGVPLGPLFRAIPERAPVVAVLESVSAQVLGGHLGWSPHRYFSETMFIADGANLSPYVIYEDEIAKTGIPPTVKAIILPKCDVLTRTTYESLVRFQKRGGRLIGDRMLVPGLKADAEFVTFEEEEKNTHGDFDDGFQGRFVDSEVRQASVQSAARKLKAAVGLELYADSDKIDILVHARSYGTADYVFAVNDRRTAGDYIGSWRLVLEKGQPNAGVVTVKRTAGAVYDLVKHRTVPFESKDGVTRIPVSYDTNDGRVFMVVDAPLRPLSFTVEGSKLTVTSPDRAAMIPIRIDGFGAKPWYAVVKDGCWSRDFGAAPVGLRVTNFADGKLAKGK